MTTRESFYTAEQFNAFVHRPENVDKRFEFIGGEIVEVPSNAYVSEIAAQIIFLIKLFLSQNSIKGHVTGEGGGYQVAGERYAPDVAYLSVEKQEQLDREGYNTVPPDLAVEVVSSDANRERDLLRIKVFNYLADGVTVWVVEPERRTVEVYVPGATKVAVYREGDTLNGGTVLPGLSINVADVFNF